MEKIEYQRYHDLFIIPDMFTRKECSRILDSIDLKSMKESDEDGGATYSYEVDDFVVNRLKQLFEKIYEEIRLPYKPMSVVEKSSILKYSKGEYCKEHIDNTYIDGIYCDYMFSIILNDNYTGGELIFPTVYKEPIKGEGLALIWPASFLYPHMVMPITGGERYSLPLPLAYWSDNRTQGKRFL